MIIDFKPLDLTIFEGKFNGHVIRIMKQSSGNWKTFVDNEPTKLIKDSALSCMKAAEEAAIRVLTDLKIREI